jgi:hypothetical protein
VLAVRHEPEVLDALDSLTAELQGSALGRMAGVRGRSDAARLALRLGLRDWLANGLDATAILERAAEVEALAAAAIRAGVPAENVVEDVAAVVEDAAGYPPERRADDRPGVGAWARSGDTNRSPAHLVVRETAGGLLMFACGKDADPRGVRAAPEDAKRCPKCEGDA